MKSFIALAASAVAIGTDDHFRFMNYIGEFGKNYATVEEYEFRMANWLVKDIEIAEHNMTNSSFSLGHNHMSDWSQFEFSKILTHKPMPEEDKQYVDLPEVQMNGGVDWRSHNAVTPVKDQGQCGSCWSFSSTGALEGAHSIKTGKLLSFAEQQLVDCSTANYGCNGGWQYKAFKYFESHDAILESNYKYTAKDGTCQYSSKSKTNVEVSTYANVRADNVDQMKAAVAKQPLSVSIEADKSVFQSYSSGIFNSSKCGTSLDHAVLVVGYGSSGSTEYWIMKNSWGKSWGESGYMRMEIESGKGVCGVQMEPLYPTSN